ncbi:MAG TPA: glycosyltransferase family 2 protein [Capsulimonadaceae bacterium]|nr:glycosyltransferase family 2 protein [Capsulimonadaceae bacterium]
MKDLAQVCALVPAYNEADRIGSTVAALRSRGEISRIVVIDDGSRDATAEKAQEAGAYAVIKLPKNGGKGAALTAGYQQEKENAEIFLLLDADLGPSATECVKLLQPVLDDQADMTIGLLPPDPQLAEEGRDGGGMGFVVGLARWGIKKRTGQALAQPLSGQRAVRRAVLEAIGGKFSSGFGVEVGLTLSAAERGFRIEEVETAFRHRVTGDEWKDFLHRGRQFMDVAQVLFLRT